MRISDWSSDVCSSDLSLWAVYDSLLAATGNDPDAIVLDFSAGSGTTGHAVMELNKDTGGNSRFILAQLPEPVDGNKKFPTIFEVKQARLKAARDRIKATSADLRVGKKWVWKCRTR